MKDPKRVAIGKRSKRKGKTGELEFRNLLREFGYESARRSAQVKGTPDSPDVECAELEFIYFEVKREERLNVYKAFEEAVEDAGPDQVPVLFWRRNRKPWLAIMDGRQFIGGLGDG